MQCKGLGFHAYGDQYMGTVLYIVTLARILAYGTVSGDIITNANVHTLRLFF